MDLANGNSHPREGAIEYMAPELSKNQPTLNATMFQQILNDGLGESDLLGYSPKADIWSLAVVMYECLTGRQAFRGEDPQELRERQVDMCTDMVPCEGRQLPRFLVEGNLSREAQDFLARCLKVEPEKREELEKLLDHELIRKYSAKVEILGEVQFINAMLADNLINKRKSSLENVPVVRR